MKIHAFKVEPLGNSQSLEDVLKEIRGDKIDARVRLVNSSEVRIDSIDERDGVWLMDFAKFRQTQGPGKGSRKSKVVGFDFKKGETFAEETAALFDPGTGYILIQYNHSGVRAGAISQYFSEYCQVATNDYSFKPRFDPDTERRLLKKAIKRNFSFRIDVTEMSEQDLKRGVALKDAINLGKGCSAGLVNVILAAGGPKDHGLGGAFTDMLQAVRELAANNPPAVKSVKISGKENEDAAVEVLDLLVQRLCVDLDIKPGMDLRLPLEERWKGLFRARAGWKGVLT